MAQGRVVAVCAALTVLLGWCGQAHGLGSRKLVVGQALPEFSIMDSGGKEFRRGGSQERALLAVFLSAGQTRSVRAAEDIKGILSKLGPSGKDLDALLVFNDPNDPLRKADHWEEASANVHIAVDPNLSLWGKFGLIVMPSVLICDAGNKVVWIEPSYGYNSAPVVRSRLKQAMGIEQQVSPDEAGEVKTVVNNTVEAKIARHVQMAKMMMSKGMFDVAVSELGKAQELDPNSLGLKLELGELYCRGNKPDEAISLLAGAQGTSREEKTGISLVLGWAHREKKDLKTAEKLLLEAVTMDPRSVRGLFELGQVYQAQGDLELAATTYRRALQVALGDPRGKSVSR